MFIPIPTTQPFSFRQTLAFVQRFMPIRTDYVLGDDSLTAAIAIGGRAVTFTISGDTELVDGPKQHAAVIARRASDFVGATADRDRRGQ
jgi:hypothetical protein